jgi:hypothetical protein
MTIEQMFLMQTQAVQAFGAIYAQVKKDVEVDLQEFQDFDKFED